MTVDRRGLPNGANTGLNLMKKTFISLILILLAYFFAINPSYCEEDFFLDGDFSESKNKLKIPNSKVKKAIENSKQSGLFSKFKKNTKFNYQTNETEIIPKGYYGTLPDINEDFIYKKQSAPSIPKVDMQIIDEQNELNEENLKKAPFDDSLFLDMVIKKEPDSEYVNDIQKIKFALNNLKKCIEENGEIQRFNACVNHLELYIQNLKNKYENKSDSLKESYIDLLNTNYYAKVLGNLKYDANYYARFIPVQDGQYSKENIAQEEQKLLNRINKTIFLLNNEN